VPVTVSCGQTACGSDYYVYACSAPGWSWTNQTCQADAGPEGGSACECLGRGPGDVPVTVGCGQTACGSDYYVYACSAPGWSWTDQTCLPDTAPGGGP